MTQDAGSNAYKELNTRELNETTTDFLSVSMVLNAKYLCNLAEQDN